MKLSDYQEEAIKRFLDNPTYGCFDAPGAGKSAVAINSLILAERWPAVITMPAHLVTQFRNEMIRWGFPEDEIAAAPRGTSPRERLEALTSGCAVKLVSYNSWSSDKYIRLLLSPGNGLYIFDESHRLRRGRKGHGEVWKSVKRLRTKTRSRHLNTPVWFLSGTPLVKDATDIWPFLAMCAPFRFTSRRDFMFRYCQTYETPYGTGVGPVLNPEKFRKLVGRYSIRRTLEQIPELARLQRRDIELPVTLTLAERRRHREIKYNYRDPATNTPFYSASAVIHALRRLTIPAKIEALTELLSDHPGRWLVLAWYRDSSTDIFNAVKRCGRPAVYIDGGTSEKERTNAFQQYQHDPNCVLVGTIGSLREGLDLQRGSQVALVEKHYLETDNSQAVSRVFRRGQLKPVLAFEIYAERSFDMRVRRVASKRQASIEQALDDFLEEEEWNVA